MNRFSPASRPIDACHGRFSPLSDQRSGSAGGGISRRRFSAVLASFVGFPFLEGTEAHGAFILGELPIPPGSFPLFDEAVSRVLPEAGFQSRIALKDSVLRLVEHGVIDRGKFFTLYGMSGPHPDEFAKVLSEPSPHEILLTGRNATYYVNLLWPVGLATRMTGNADSPLNGVSLYNFASTGGWTLGREANGGSYFDKFPIVDLTEEQAARVVAVAETIYRPCCNNSTFFQDCNHGSALLGVLQLGAAQGLGTEELYREALAFNSFWFPYHYVRTALFFKVIKRTEWPDVDPKVVLGFRYSAGGPWRKNIATLLEAHPDLVPPEPGFGASCSV